MTEDAPLSPELLPAGPDGIELRFARRPEPAAMAAVQVLAAEIAAAPPEGLRELVPGLVSVLLRLDPGAVAAVGPGLLARARAIAATRPALPAPTRRWTIPAAFGGAEGPDLAAVAARLGQSEAAAAAQICAAELRVLTIGFAPGQPYIGLLPEAWNLPRLPELTPSVPAGALVVAVRQLVLFGAASATGWRQVAQVAFRPFRPDRAAPMPLRAGDAIRFAAAPADQIAALAGDPQGLGGARLEVLA